MSVIRSVEAFPLRLPTGSHADGARYRTVPYVRSVYPSRDETMLVRIATDDHVGWGEALTPVTPEAPAAIIENLLGPLLVGTDVRAAGPVTLRMQESMRERGHLEGHHADAVCGVDIALWDLFGKEAGRPVHELLGGAYRERVPLYLTSVGGAGPEAKAEAARQAYLDGFSRMKLHLSMEPAGVLRTVDAVLEAVAEVATDDRTPQIAVDTHWVHDLSTARHLARAFDERGVWFFEAPLAPEDLPGHELLAAGSATPLAVGEAMRSRFVFSQWAARRAMAVAQPDIGRTGITEGAKIAAALAAQYVPIAPHHSMATALAYAAGLHVTAAAEHVAAMEYGPAVLAKSTELMTSEAMAEGAVADSSVGLGTRPGLGVEVDEEAVRAMAARFPD